MFKKSKKLSSSPKKDEIKSTIKSQSGTKKFRKSWTPSTKENSPKDVAESVESETPKTGKKREAKSTPPSLSVKRRRK